MAILDTAIIGLLSAYLPQGGDLIRELKKTADRVR
jgi:hypothetical protein